MKSNLEACLMLHFVIHLGHFLSEWTIDIEDGIDLDKMSLFQMERCMCISQLKSLLLNPGMLDTLKK